MKKQGKPRPALRAFFVSHAHILRICAKTCPIPAIKGLNNMNFIIGMVIALILGMKNYTEVMKGKTAYYGGFSGSITIRPRKYSLILTGKRFIMKPSIIKGRKKQQLKRGEYA